MSEADFVPDYSELSQSAQRLLRPCRTCRQLVGHIRRHILDSHLPFFTAPTKYCWKCEWKEGRERPFFQHFIDHPSCHFGDDDLLWWTGLITTLLSYLKDKLGLNDPDELVSFATTNFLYLAVGDKASPEELLLLDHFRSAHFGQDSPNSYFRTPR